MRKVMESLSFTKTNRSFGGPQNLSFHQPTRGPFIGHRNVHLVPLIVVVINFQLRTIYVQHCCHNYLLFGRVGEPATHAASFSAARDESLRVERVSPPTPSSNYPSVKFVILIAMQLISSLSRTKGVLIERLLSR